MTETRTKNKGTRGAYKWRDVVAGTFTTGAAEMALITEAARVAKMSRNEFMIRAALREAKSVKAEPTKADATA